MSMLEWDWASELCEQTGSWSTKSCCRVGMLKSVLVCTWHKWDGTMVVIFWFGDEMFKVFDVVLVCCCLLTANQREFSIVFLTFLLLLYNDCNNMCCQATWKTMMMSDDDYWLALEWIESGIHKSINQKAKKKLERNFQEQNKTQNGDAFFTKNVSGSPSIKTKQKFAFEIASFCLF